MQIFGYDWQDIQRAQRGGRLARSIDVHQVPTHIVTEEDRSLLTKHGSINALKEAGLYGTADRLERASSEGTKEMPHGE